MKIGLVAPVKPSHPYLENDPAPLFDLHYLRISPWLWFSFTGVGVGFQVHLLILHRPSQPLHEDVVGVAPFPVHADLDRMVLKDPDELPAGELAAPSLRWGKLWSVLNSSGLPWPSASVRASAQKPASRVLDNRQPTTYRLCQSMMATR